MFAFFSTLKQAFQDNTDESSSDKGGEVESHTKGSKEWKLDAKQKLTKTSKIHRNLKNKTINKDFGYFIYWVKIRWRSGCSIVANMAYHWVPNKVLEIKIKYVKAGST